jgi:hypothetical protein
MPRAAVADAQAMAGETMQEIVLVLARGGAAAAPRVLLESNQAQAWLDLWRAYVQQE